MERGQIEHVSWQGEETNPNSYPVSQDRNEEFHSDRRLCYASKLFPRDAFVTVIGREGIYRIVSEPYIPVGYSYPHFDVEAFGKRICVSVFTASRIYVS